MRYADMSQQALREELEREREAHHSYVDAALSLDMARGKPCAAQLDLSTPLLSLLAAPGDCFASDGTDCRNYGVLAGIPEARELMARMLDDDPAATIVFGNSSLTVMYDTLARCLDFGTAGSKPWAQLESVKWLCPVPGYDRHFAITEAFGIEMIPLPLVTSGPLLGPPMDKVERLVAADPSIKGIWCVPKYSNPTGITYSDEVVRRLASMECAAEDFRIFWDNAYCVHDLFDEPSLQDHLSDIGAACRAAGNPNRYFKFASTSKVTFPGAGISAFAASPANIAETLKHVSAQMIGNDKLTQLRHARFFSEEGSLDAHMAAHAAILRPKFDLVLERLEAEMGPCGAASWSHPKGGYFVSFDGLPGTASRTVELAKEAGVTLTGAGATWPGGVDPNDSNLRIAPSMPSLEELASAMDVFACCAKMAALEVLLAS